ncbi:MAG: glycosylase [Bacteroidetes bacterium]|nr:MAG: glycosylase [Bacteroidota bacterium]
MRKKFNWAKALKQDWFLFAPALRPGQIKFFLSWALAHFIYIAVSAQKEVPQSLMQKIYDEVKTPYKYGLVVTPEYDSKKIDCPSVFRKGKDWYMTYILFDGRGYETWLAKSKDLLEWKTLGKIMSFGDTTNKDATEWDANQKAGYIALQDHKWEGSYKLEKYNKKYWMSFIGGKEKGYETGKLSIGIAHTDKDPTKPHEWKRVGDPVLSISDIDVRWWENKKLYKSSVIWDKDKTLGHPFVMYYNANGDTSNNTPKWRWFERIGMAVSDDMINWQRYQIDPVVHHKIGITGDGVIQKIGDVWVMFYFGAFWEERKNEAFNRFACSYDLVNWTDWNGDDLIKSTEDYDAKYAHKSYVVKWKGVVYHFYCAVDNKDHRGIAVATSVDKGKSKMKF